MKGIVFTEFLEMVDAKFGMAVTERMVNQTDLPSGGAYTSIGTYDHDEIVALVTSLSAITEIGAPDLVRTFGEHLMGRFVVLFPDFFSSVPDLLSFLETVDGLIHQEVHKLYSNATLPDIHTERQADGGLILTYKSARQMADLAEGLIAGAILQFGGSHRYERTDLPQEGAKQCVRFALSPIN